MYLRSKVRIVSGGISYRAQKTLVDLPHFGPSLENPLPDGRGSEVLRVGRALPSREREYPRSLVRVVSGGIFLATCTLLNVYWPQKTFVDLRNFGPSLENPLPDGRGSVVLRVGTALPSRDRKEAGGRHRRAPRSGAVYANFRNQTSFIRGILS